MDHTDEPVPIDYLTLRNLDSLRAWRQRCLVYAQKCQDDCAEQYSEIDLDSVEP